MGFLIKVIGKDINDISVFLEHTVDQILEGKLIAFPTDSVYGIGGDPFNLQLIQRIYSIKFRESTKGFLLLVSDIEEAKRIADFNATEEKLANKFWPGQLTLILKRKESSNLPLELSAFQPTIGLRVPEHPIVLKILELLKSRGRFGGIIGTSANFSGEAPATSGEEIAKNFMGIIDLIIDAGESDSENPSTIIDCSDVEIKFLRIGKISQKDILDYMKDK